MRLLVSLFCGALFGAGLTVSGMTDTARVQGWLDIAGAWDPTLAFVLGGAILPMALAWMVARRRDRAVLGTAFPATPPARLDARLITGSAFFGFGWALVGLCPGPAMAVLGHGGTPALIFFAAMVVGMWGARALPAKAATTPIGDPA